MWFFSQRVDVKLTENQWYRDPFYEIVNGTTFILEQEIKEWVETLKHKPEKVVDKASGARLLRFKNKNDAILFKMKFG